MTFEKMPVDGCCLIKRNIPWDDRGCFSRLADIEEFKANGLNHSRVHSPMLAS